MEKTQKAYYKLDKFEINQKTYLIPHHDLHGCEQYFERKIPAQVEGYRERKFYDKDELKSMESKLTCGIKKKDYKKSFEEKVEEVVEVREIKEEEIKEVKVVRPALMTQGPTHFINISVSSELRDVYENAIQATIQEETLPLLSLHINLLSFRLEKQEDLDKWSSIMKDIKKKKINIKGMGIIGEKNQYARRIYLNVQGIDDIVDTIIGKAIDRNLIKENNLVSVKFDKKTQSYKSERSYITILKTKGKDLVDAKEYLTAFKNLSFTGLPVNEFRISVIGSFVPGKGFYNDRVIGV